MENYEKKNKDAISTIKQALRQLATNGVPVGNMIEAIKDIEEKYAESEDEKIRKEIKAFIKSRGSQITQSKTDGWLAWLEKQGGHAKFINGIQVGDKVTRNEDGVLVNLSQLKRVAKPSDDIDTEKQGEQNHTWSEEDETTINNLVWAISNDCIRPQDREDYCDWLKSITMKKINVLRICYWCLLLISCFMLAIVFPKWTFKDFIMPLIIVLCAMGAGYVDRMIDEEKNK